MAQAKVSKEQLLREAIIQFEMSLRSKEDYLILMIVVKRVLSQGDGLCWNSVEQILAEVVSDTPKQAIDTMSLSMLAEGSSKLLAMGHGDKPVVVMEMNDQQIFMVAEIKSIDINFTGQVVLIIEQLALDEYMEQE